MNIVIDPHTLLRAEERGATKEEIMDVLQNGIPGEANKARQAKFKVFKFDGERNGKYYEQKKIEVIFAIEREQIITVTVYVFYGKWNEL